MCIVFIVDRKLLMAIDKINIRHGALPLAAGIDKINIRHGALLLAVLVGVCAQNNGSTVEDQ